MNEIANRVYVATPTPRDNKERLPVDLPPRKQDLEDGDMTDENTPLTADKITAKKLKEQWEREMNLFEMFDPDFKGVDHRER